MKSERIILSAVAIFVGLIVAGIAFYFYQMTKTIAEPEKQQTNAAAEIPTPTPDSSLFLTVQTPRNEEVVTKKTLSISGKTIPDATVIISSENEDSVIKPAKNGDFTVTQAISDGANLIQITAVFPNGEERRMYRTVTYSAENF